MKSIMELSTNMKARTQLKKDLGLFPKKFKNKYGEEYELWEVINREKAKYRWVEEGPKRGGTFHLIELLIAIKKGTVEVIEW